MRTPKPTSLGESTVMPTSREPGMNRTTKIIDPRFNFCYGITTLLEMEAAVLAFKACPFAILGLPDFARQHEVSTAAEALAKPVDTMPDEPGFIPVAWDRILPTVNAIRVKLAAEAKRNTEYAFHGVKGLDQLHKEGKARAFEKSFHAEWLKAIMGATATADEILAHNQPVVDAKLAREKVEKAAKDALFKRLVEVVRDCLACSASTDSSTTTGPRPLPRRGNSVQQRARGPADQTQQGAGGQGQGRG